MYQSLITEGTFSGLTGDVMLAAGGVLAAAVAVAGVGFILKVLFR